MCSIIVFVAKATMTARSKIGRALRDCPVNDITKPTAVNGAFMVMAKKILEPINIAEVSDNSGTTN